VPETDKTQSQEKSQFDGVNPARLPRMGFCGVRVHPELNGGLHKFNPTFSLSS
jgi:hypothetical protein